MGAVGGAVEVSMAGGVIGNLNQVERVNRLQNKMKNPINIRKVF